MDVSLEEAHHLFDAGAACPVVHDSPDWSGVPVGAEFCSPQTERCADARDYEVDRRACCRAIVHELVRWVGAALDRFGITWWIDYGTLLGAVRNGGMIPWDKDADIGILATDLDAALLLKHTCQSLGMGFDVSGIGTLKFRCSKTNATNLDAFAWYERAGGMMERRKYAPVDGFKGREFPRELLFPLTRIEWEGLSLPAPRDPEAFCAHRYGPDWRTPLRAAHGGVRR